MYPPSAYATLILQAAKVARKGLASPTAIRDQLVAITYVQLYVWRNITC